MSKISIAVVDDHKLFRQMWSIMFAHNNEIEITGEAGALEEAIEMIKRIRPDIVFLDINLPDGSGIDAVPLIRKFSPGTRIIAVSMHNQTAYAKKMMQMGAKGYITKNSSHEEMLIAIKEVMKGKLYVCDEIKDILSCQMLSDTPKESNINDLSLREIGIIKLIKEGLYSKEISLALNISIRTVEVHRHNILKKLKLKNSAALIQFISTSNISFD